MADNQHARERDRAYKKQRYEKDPSFRETIWIRNLRYKFGISSAEYKYIYEQQEGLCAICLKPETTTRKGVVKKLAVDHDHKTGRVRALLCHRCNTLLGFARENRTHILSAIEYLSKTYS